MVSGSQAKSGIVVKTEDMLFVWVKGHLSAKSVQIVYFIYQHILPEY